MRVIIGIVHLSIDLKPLSFISSGGAFLQPFIELSGQVVELAGGSVEQNIGEANSSGRRLLLKVVEVIVAAVVSDADIVLLSNIAITGNIVVADNQSGLNAGSLKLSLDSDTEVFITTGSDIELTDINAIGIAFLSKQLFSLLQIVGDGVLQRIRSGSGR